MPILFVRGFFQSDKYFDFIEDTIREDFRFKIEPNKKSLLEMKIKSSQPIRYAFIFEEEIILNTNVFRYVMKLIIVKQCRI